MRTLVQLIGEVAAAARANFRDAAWRPFILGDMPDGSFENRGEGARERFGNDGARCRGGEGSDRVEVFRKFAGTKRDADHGEIDQLGMNRLVHGLMKIDVDGYEFDVVQGGENLFLQGNGDVLVETHSLELEKNVSIGFRNVDTLAIYDAVQMSQGSSLRMPSLRARRRVISFGRLNMDLGPDFRLFCLALRCPPNADDLQQMRELAAGIEDWNVIVRGARRHRVASLVLSGLRACSSPHVPALVLAELDRRTRSNARRSLVQATEIGRLVRLFADAGISLFVLKGEALAVQLYGEHGWRAAGDIDLLVDPDQFAGARAVLADAGYQQRSVGRSSRQEAAYLRLVKEVGFVHTATGGLVELHHRLTDNPYLLAVEFRSLWREREEVRLGDQSVATLPRQRLPLYLCAHGAHHSWARLNWLVDFAMAVRQSQDIESVVVAADQAGLKPLLLHALALSHELLGLPVEQYWLVAHRDSALGRRLDRLLARYYAAVDWHGPVLPKQTLRYALKTDWRYRATQLQQDILFCPAEVPLPGPLLFLYPLVRPWGWLIRHAPHFRRRDRRLKLRLSSRQRDQPE